MVTEAVTSGPGGSELETYAYDDAGNMTERSADGVTQAMSWDAEGRLTGVAAAGDTTEFVYSADGERLLRRDQDGSTLYLGKGQELRYDRDTGQVTGTRYYTHVGTTIAVRTPEKLTWMVSDHHGTTEAMVDADDDLSVSRRRTAPFGDPRGPEPAFWVGDKGFVGGTEDPTGLIHLGARLYDPGLGRFISVDPIIDFDDPQQMHGYAYANNTPATMSDPDGLLAKRGGKIKKKRSKGGGIKLNNNRRPGGKKKSSGGGGRIKLNNNRWSGGSKSSGGGGRSKRWSTPAPRREPGLVFNAAPGSSPATLLAACTGCSRSELYDRYAQWYSDTLGKWYARLARLGGDCEYRQGLRVCNTSLPIFARGGTTLGDTFVTDQDLDAMSNRERRELLDHEKHHRDEQWEKYGGAFVFMYLWEEATYSGACNRYERDAQSSGDAGYHC